MKFDIFFTQATQLRRLINEAGDALSHTQNSVAIHSVLRAFAEVIYFFNLLWSSLQILR
jgi:hypothetical protein